MSGKAITEYRNKIIRALKALAFGLVIGLCFSAVVPNAAACSMEGIFITVGTTEPSSTNCTALPNQTIILKAYYLYTSDDVGKTFEVYSKFVAPTGTGDSAIAYLDGTSNSTYTHTSGTTIKTWSRDITEAVKNYNGGLGTFSFTLTSCYGGTGGSSSLLCEGSFATGCVNVTIAPATASVPTGLTPGDVSPFYPALISNTVTLDWNDNPSAEQVDSYDVGVYKTSDGSAVSGATTWDSQFGPIDLSYGEKYYWKVRAHNSSGWGGYTSNYYIEPNRLPVNPVNSTPYNNFTSAPLNQEIGWNGGDPDSNDRVYYEVHFGTSSTPGVHGYVNDRPYDEAYTTYNPGALAPNTTYYWYIVAKDNHDVNAASPSSTTYFTTGGGALPAPANLRAAGVLCSTTSSSPTDVSDVTPELSWDAVPGATQYYISVKNMGGTEVAGGGPSTNSFTVPDGVLTIDTEYYFYVSAYDGSRGPDSANAYFRVVAGSDTTTVRVSAGSGSVAVYNTYTFTDVGTATESSPLTFNRGTILDSYRFTAAGSGAYVFDYYTSCSLEPTGHYTTNPVTVGYFGLPVEVCYFFKVPGTPAFTKAIWSSSSTGSPQITAASAGDTVYMYAESANIAAGASVSFAIYENDIIGDDYVTTITTTMGSGGKAYAPWTATYVDDAPFNPPEYIFVVTSGSASLEVSDANELDLAEVPTFTKATWSSSSTGSPKITTASVGDIVVLYTESKGIAAGTSVIFEIYENDTVGDDWVSTISTTMGSGGKAYAYWNVTYEDDAPFNPPEYIFVVTSGSASLTVSDADELHLFIGPVLAADNKSRALRTPISLTATLKDADGNPLPNKNAFY